MCLIKKVRKIGRIATEILFRLSTAKLINLKSFRFNGNLSTLIGHIALATSTQDNTPVYVKDFDSFK